MQISAKMDYAVRALLALAARDPELVRVDTIVDDQDMPGAFIREIIGELRRAGLIRSQRGNSGGYSLARPPGEISIGDIFRALDGQLIEIHGLHPQETNYPGAAAHLPQVWIAMRDSLQQMLDETSLANVVEGSVPTNAYG